MWVFGIIGERTGRMVVKFVPSRNAETLEHILLQHLELNGVELHSDGWGAYQRCLRVRQGKNWMRNIHENRVGNPRTMAHSNLIEGLWGNLQRKLQMIYGQVPGGTAAYEDFVFEALWRIQLDREPLD